MDENQVVDETNEVAQQQEERTFTQDDVNRIVGSNKAEAERRARAKAEQEYQVKLEAQQSQAQSQGQQQVDADAIYQQVQEKFNADMQQRAIENEVQAVADSYISKMAQGRERYDDFDDMVKDFDATAFPQLIYMVSGMENASDIIYELAKNPVKLASIDRLAEKSPKQAQSELAKLGASIETNRQAQADAADQQVNDPLNKLQPSRISGDNSKLSIGDLRSQPWLRG